jgi:tetratricopeptide (TPR) repeat protein
VEAGRPATPAANLAYPTNTAELTSQLLPAVQRGYNLAQHGAFFAARTEFIQVLRRVAQAKDAGSASDEHARALAAGLRALDEADDFVPQGVQLEAELDVRSVASSHRTPLLRDYPEDVLPEEAVTMYHSYAQQRLASAAANEQTGSMALYGLGKVYARMAERRDDDVQCTRSAMTMYSAALEACPNNHLAANELGFLLCRTGHPAESIKQFQRAIDLAPNAIAYHNLAVAQEKLGRAGQAAANEQQSQRLAAIERSQGQISQRAGVQWVSPGEMARVTQPISPSPSTPSTFTAAKPAPPARTTWR